MSRKTRKVLARFAAEPDPTLLTHQLTARQIMKDCRITSGRLYPILDRLEREGLIWGEWWVNITDHSLPRRRYYALTEQGRKVAAEL